jgi:hypothetical protein
MRYYARRRQALSSRELAAALLGVVGVYLLGEPISYTLTWILFNPPDSNQILQLQRPYWLQLLMVAVFFAWLLAFGAALVLNRNRIASLLYPEPSQPRTRIGVADLQTAAFAVIGLVFFVNSSATLIYDFTQLAPDQGISGLWPRSAESIAKVVLGIALFLGARGIAGAWLLARQAGVKPPASD